MKLVLFGIWSALLMSVAARAQQIPPAADPGTASFKWIQAGCFQDAPAETEL